MTEPLTAHEAPGGPPQGPDPDPDPHQEERSAAADEVRFVQEMLQQTIASADGKTSVLVAVIALTLGVALPGVPLAAGLESGRVVGVVGGVLALVGLVLCGASGYFMLQALTPSLRAGAFSRYSLPDIHRASVDELAALSQAGSVREGWVQAKNLAAISTVKHAMIKRALMLYPASVVAIGAGWLLLSLARVR